MTNKLYKNIVNFIKENIFFLLVLIIIFIVLSIKLPWSVYAPGGVIDVSKRLSGDVNKYDGKINMTYVSFLEGSVPSLFLSLILPEWDIVSNKDITLDGESLEIANIRDKISMQESISNATLVAYNYANKDIKITSTKSYIMYLIEEAETDLKVGDLILEYDNIKLEKFSNLTEYIKGKNVGEVVTFKVKRKGKEIKSTAKIIKYKGEKVIGVSLSHINEYEKNPNINYESKNKESGSSGGLMLSLAIYNSLIDKDITKKLNISGTGTIDEEGNVGEISGVKYKLSGAVKNKSDVFLVPSANYEEALKIKNKHNYKIKIIEAKTFEQILKELEKL